MGKVLYLAYLNPLECYLVMHDLLNDPLAEDTSPLIPAVSDPHTVINQLTTRLIKYSESYHKHDKSLISDEEYDQLFHQLLLLEKKYPEYKHHDSPTTRVGATAKFSPKEHVIPMLSLNNIFSDISHKDITIRHKELLQFDKRISENLAENKPITYVASPKYDGVAISITYIDGILTQALTRGDGFIGEDVTENIKTIGNIPKQLSNLSNKELPNLLEVRGEVLILTNDFIELNQKQKELGLKTFANPRNTAAGCIRQLDSSITRARPLHFFAYAISQASISFTTFFEQLNYLKNLGFAVSNLNQLVTGANDLISYYEQTLSGRNNIPFGVDGVVYKVNQISDQEKLGFVMRAPRFAIAHKFPAEEVESQLLDIQIQVGRTGALTPVAKIKPVLVGGVIVSNASLHNADEIYRKDIRINDFVLIRRAGDVIPEVIKVILNKRSENSQLFAMPTTCPVCDSHLIQLPGETIIRCSGGLYCQAQKLQSITHFASKLALNIDGMGEKVVGLLIDNNLVSNPADIYRLTLNQLINLPRFGKKSAENLISAINKSKTTTLSRLIYALGIRHVGESTAKALANTFGKLDAFMCAPLDELMQINDIGEIVAKSIVDFFLEAHNSEIIAQLLELGINYPISSSKSKFNSNISGKTFVLTGTLNKFSRETAKALIAEYGGKVSASVSKKTDYVVAGIEAGNKLDRARELGIAILDESKFNALF